MSDHFIPAVCRSWLHFNVLLLRFNFLIQSNIMILETLSFLESLNVTQCFLFLFLSIKWDKVTYFWLPYYFNECITYILSILNFMYAKDVKNLKIENPWDVWDVSRRIITKKYDDSITFNTINIMVP